MRCVFAALILLVPGAISSALPVVDQVNEITQSVGGRIIYAGNSPDSPLLQMQLDCSPK